jgi:hypothetical protein
MMTADDLDAWAERWRAQLAAVPPWTEARVADTAALLGSIRLRMARDRARASARDGSEIARGANARSSAIAAARESAGEAVKTPQDTPAARHDSLPER